VGALKTRELKTWHLIARVENAGVENEGVECAIGGAWELKDKCTRVGEVIRKQLLNSSSKKVQYA